MPARGDKYVTGRFGGAINDISGWRGLSQRVALNDRSVSVMAVFNVATGRRLVVLASIIQRQRATATMVYCNSCDRYSLARSHAADGSKRRRRAMIGDDTTKQWRRPSRARWAVRTWPALMTSRETPVTC